jgi:hypothetical protein
MSFCGDEPACKACACVLDRKSSCSAREDEPAGVIGKASEREGEEGDEAGEEGEKRGRRRLGTAGSLIIEGNLWWSFGLFWMASYVVYIVLVQCKLTTLHAVY